MCSIYFSNKLLFLLTLFFIHTFGVKLLASAFGFQNSIKKKLRDPRAGGYLAYCINIAM